jgi:hypothetical protein
VRKTRAPAASLTTRHDETTHRAGGVQVRLLFCDTCRACWPTERDILHGGSRSDGEPCAYVFPNGQVCLGSVHPAGVRAAPHAGGQFVPPSSSSRKAYTGSWCEVLGLPWGTWDLGLVRKAYRKLAKELHPDQGGTNDEMVRLNAAYRQALSELGQQI